MPQASHQDMSAAFLALQVYVLWPDNGIWYKAQVVKVLLLVLSGYIPVICCTCLASASGLLEIEVYKSLHPAAARKGHESSP